MKICKVMHQIYLQGYKEVPSKLKKYMEINRKMNDWSYQFWDETKIINLMEKYHYIETYNEFIYMHQKVDFAKYVILYIYGGIYIDADAYCLQPINKLIQENINYDLIVSKLNCNSMENYLHCNHAYCVNNGIIYARPNNKLLKILIDHIVKNHYCVDHISKMVCIEQTTGPTQVTDIIIQNLNDTIKILEAEYVEPCVLDVCHITKNTYIVHKHNGTWFSPQTKKMFTFYMNYKNPIYVILIILFILIVLGILYYKGYIYN